jgi:hypothetical protein
MVQPMTFRIETAARGRFTVFVLNGRIEIRAIAELRRLFELQLDRDTLRFFADCEAEGAEAEELRCLYSRMDGGTGSRHGAQLNAPQPLRPNKRRTMMATNSLAKLTTVANFPEH